MENPHPTLMLGYERPPEKKKRRVLRRVTETGGASVSVSYAVDDAVTQWEDPTVHRQLSTSDTGTQCAAPPPPPPLYTTLLKDNQLCLLYTGLSLDAFHSVAEELTQGYSNSFQLHPRDQLLMTLMKLRRNLVQGDLAERFGISQSAVSEVISRWLDLMEEKGEMRRYLPWLPGQTVKATTPQCSRENDPNTAHVIDCSETPLEKSRDLDSRCESYSHYYGLTGLACTDEQRPRNAGTQRENLAPKRLSNISFSRQQATDVLQTPEIRPVPVPLPPTPRFNTQDELREGLKHLKLPASSLLYKCINVSAAQGQEPEAPAS